jgi:hypothetical protein
VSDRELRDLLERVHHDNQVLRESVSTLGARVTELERQLAETAAEKERLARLLLKGGLSPGAQTSDFSVAQVAALVEFLKK